MVNLILDNIEHKRERKLEHINYRNEERLITIMFTMYTAWTWCSEEVEPEGEINKTKKIATAESSISS